LCDRNPLIGGFIVHNDSIRLPDVLMLLVGLTKKTPGDLGSDKLL
jgi:hypothetical protein